MKIELSQGAFIPAQYMNRHALVTGPTGTGKTVSILRLVESLSALGVPVIAPDVKGDLPPLFRSCACRLLRPSRGLCVPLWIMGADLLARALELTEAQSGALEIAFSFADEQGAALDSLSDLRALLARLAANPAQASHLGHLTRASVGTIQRALLRVEKTGQGGLFAAPAFDISSALTGGLVTIFDASGLYHSPRIYGALMLWLLREIATRFPEAGDLDKPRLALVIDESHALFNDATPALLRSIEATARLVRSKGVALIFASQSESDLPDIIAAQCATRIQHSRALGVGNALFSTLDSRGNLTPEKRIRPSLPRCFALRPVAGEAAPPEAAPAEAAPAEGLPFMTWRDVGNLCALGALGLALASFLL